MDRATCPVRPVSVVNLGRPEYLHATCGPKGGVELRDGRQDDTPGPVQCPGETRRRKGRHFGPTATTGASGGIRRTPYSTLLQDLATPGTCHPTRAWVRRGFPASVGPGEEPGGALTRRRSAAVSRPRRARVAGSRVPSRPSPPGPLRVAPALGLTPES